MGSRSSSKQRPRLALFAFAAFASFASSARAQPQDRARTEALARRATERLQALQREADRLASEERSLLNDVKKLELERQLRAEELKRVEAEAAGVQAELDANNARIASLEAADRAETPELRARLVEIYKMGQARYLRLLLATSDLRRLGQSTRTVAALAKLDRDRIASHARTRAELQRERKTLVDREAQLAGELQSAQQHVQAALRDLATGATNADAVSLPLRPFRGDIPWPVAGTVARRFGRTASASGASNGIEIAALEGTDARAVHDGVVAFAGTFAGFGNLVILDHGSQSFSLYGDLLDIAVKKGGRVDQGQRVGTVGATSSGASGLYFELRVDGQPVDPLQWLRRR